MYCRNCRQTLSELVLIAMMEDSGARCHPGANHCPETGGEHEFVEHDLAAPEES